MGEEVINTAEAVPGKADAPTIEIAAHAGTCYGVQRALDMALAAAPQAGESTQVHTLGPLIHNPIVVRELAEAGVGLADTLDDAASGTVIIRAHGVVPQVIDAVDVPVIAAGGIADGRQAAAALALGACGVQVGTCLLASTECPIHENYKAALLKARDSDTIVTGRIGGTPVRVLKNRMSREYVRQEKAGADKMALERFTLGSLRKAVFDGDTENGSLMAGQAAGLLHEVRPVEEIFAAMVSEAKTCITGLYKETI